MTKDQFFCFVETLKEGGAVRLSISTDNGETILYWTSGEGLRECLVLFGRKGKKISPSNKKQTDNYRRWLKVIQ